MTTTPEEPLQEEKQEWQTIAPPPVPTEAVDEDYVSLDSEIGIWTIAEAILKHPAKTIYELHQGRTGKVTVAMVIISIVCLVGYGLTVGTFSMGVQLWMAPAKITLGLLFSALICLPSLFVFSCLSGADSHPARIVGSLVGMVAVCALLLLAFAPVSWIFSQSTESIAFIGFLQLLFWVIALSYGLQFLKRSVSLLNGKSQKHLSIWAIIFILVVMQMTSTLRPIIGESDEIFQKEKKFFLTHWVQQMD